MATARALPLGVDCAVAGFAALLGASSLSGFSVGLRTVDRRAPL